MNFIHPIHMVSRAAVAGLLVVALARGMPQ